MFYQRRFWSNIKWFRCYRNKSHCCRYDRVVMLQDRYAGGLLFRCFGFVLVSTRSFHIVLRIPHFLRCCKIVAIYVVGSLPSIAVGSGRCCRFTKLLQVRFWWSGDPDFVIMPQIILLCHRIILLCYRIILLCHGIILLCCRIILLCHVIIFLCCRIILLCFEEESKGFGRKLP